MSLIKLREDVCQDIVTHNFKLMRLKCSFPGTSFVLKLRISRLMYLVNVCSLRYANSALAKYPNALALHKLITHAFINKEKRIF